MLKFSKKKRVEINKKNLVKYRIFKNISFVKNENLKINQLFDNHVLKLPRYYGFFLFLFLLFG